MFVDEILSSAATLWSDSSFLRHTTAAQHVQVTRVILLALELIYFSTSALKVRLSFSFVVRATVQRCVCVQKEEKTNDSGLHPFDSHAAIAPLMQGRSLVVRPLLAF